jgi:two-component system NtrC family response regulator/two-component system nitrogen regulation response regulator GlnG
VATILVVDDDLDVAEGLQDLLVSEGHTVQTARTGEEGLRALRGAPLPDAILLDVDMPVLGGLGMAHQMMLHDAGEERIPIILCSGRQDLAGLAAKMGTPYSLAKPFDFHRLLALLGRVLCGRVAPRSA